MARILLADDDTEMLSMLAAWLKWEHQHTVDTAVDGQEALDFLLTYSYDVIVLDWDMPKMSGIDVCKRYRQERPYAPVLMLTGKSSTDYKIQGLDAGADDYLTKPFLAEELLARLRALMRRPAGGAPEQLTSGSLSLDPVGRTVAVGSKQLSLPPMEFALLEFFLRHQGDFFTPDVLISRVWGDLSEEITLSALRTTISRLRTKLEAAIGTCPLVSTRGAGYCWNVQDK